MKNFFYFLLIIGQSLLAVSDTATVSNNPPTATPHTIIIQQVEKPKEEITTSYSKKLILVLRELLFLTWNLNLAWKTILLTWFVGPIVQRIHGLSIIDTFIFDKIRESVASVVRLFARAASKKELKKTKEKTNRISVKLEDIDTSVKTNHQTVELGITNIKDMLVLQQKSISDVWQEQNKLDETLKNNVTNLNTSLSETGKLISGLQTMNNEFEQKFPKIDDTIQSISTSFQAVNKQIESISSGLTETGKKREELDGKLTDYQTSIRDILEKIMAKVDNQEQESGKINELLKKTIEEQVSPMFKIIQTIQDSLSSK